MKKNVNVYSLKGEVVGKEELPSVFSTAHRPDVIRKAVIAEESNRRQPYGSKFEAGMRHAVSTWGKGRGVARVQRLSQGARAAESPNNVGGRRAFPPKPERSWKLKVNKKEKALARKSALAAMADIKMVQARGHQVKEEITLPVVFEDAVEQLDSTAEVISAFASVGLHDDLVRAKDSKKVRPGRGKMRGRRYKAARSVLIVVTDKNAPLYRSARNLPGVEVVAPGELSTGILAPGGAAGRLAVFSQSALKKLGEW
ncbi:MAG: 50S ribosomal protein L4 [Methanomassiliicoccales archaeon]